MEHALRPAEIVIALMPLVVMLAVFVVVPLPDRPLYGFTDSGRRYKKVDAPRRFHLLDTRAFWLAYGLVFACAVNWALFEALSSAALSGTVSLPGMRGSPRPVVPWYAAWAYFLGLGLLLPVTMIALLNRPRTPSKTLAQAGAALLGFVGYFMLLISNVLSSWRVAVALAVVLSGLAAFGYWRLVKPARHRPPRA